MPRIYKSVKQNVDSFYRKRAYFLFIIVEIILFYKFYFYLKIVNLNRVNFRN